MYMLSVSLHSSFIHVHRFSSTILVYLSLQDFGWVKIYAVYAYLMLRERERERESNYILGIVLFNVTKVRPLFTLLHRGSDNSPLLNVFSAIYIDQSNHDYFSSFDL